MRPKALIFDVFGTLVDWRGSVSRQLAPVLAGKGIGLDPAGLADEWRAEYDPSMAPIRDGRRDYTALDLLHRENLEVILARHGLTDRFSDAEKAHLARAWERLDPWPDVLPGLSAMRKSALLAPCSNGSISLMVRLARHAGFSWDAVLGAELARNYKPHPSVYLAAVAALGLQPHQVMMVAAHNGDLKAAADNGLQTAFVPRPTEHGPGQTTDLAASGDWTLVASDLADLAERIAEMPVG